MGRAINRDIAFQRAKNKETAHEYVEQLSKSTHSRHTKVVPYLQKQLNDMSVATIDALRKEEESQAFAKKIMGE